MSFEKKSWVWEFAIRNGDKAVCSLCEKATILSCPGGTTGSVGRHLKSQHGIDPGEQQTEVPAAPTSDVLAAGSSSAPLMSEQEIGGLAGMKRGSTGQAMGSKRARVCPKDRSLEIDCSLAKMIALNQLPISFCASDGFKQFMATVEPNYVPCGEAAVKSKLRALAGQLKGKVMEKMSSANFLSCTTDSWTSIVNCAYITVTAHFVDDKWNYCSATLTTHETDQRQTAPYLADQLRRTMEEWEILEKVVSFTTDNAKNFTNAIKILEVLNVRCAAHTIQLAINKCLKVSELQNIISSCSQLVSHFKHSSVASKALKAKQEMLGLPPQKLLQSCPTRWDSVFRMLERISGNRCPLMATLADKNVIPPSVAAKLELNEASWTLVGDLCKVLKPVQVATTLFCAEDAPMAMVRPTLHKLIAKHFEFDLVDGDLLGALKASLKEELKERFWPDSLGQESMERVATIFDPRFKGMEFETPETRDVIIAYVQREIDTALESEPAQDNTSNEMPNAYDFLFGESSGSDTSQQLINYLAEPALPYHRKPLEWWQAREKKYPQLAEMAKKFLCIPATSASSERTFSGAGNIATAKRNSLTPENVRLLVFLNQNKKFYS